MRAPGRKILEVGRRVAHSDFLAFSLPGGDYQVHGDSWGYTQLMIDCAKTPVRAVVLEHLMLNMLGESEALLFPGQQELVVASVEEEEYVEWSRKTRVVVTLRAEPCTPRKGDPRLTGCVPPARLKKGRRHSVSLGGLGNEEAGEKDGAPRRAASLSTG